MKINDVIELDITAMAHGGEAVARYAGQVVFVRGALPGEQVSASVTSAPGHGRFLRASVIDVVRPSPDRVTPPCSYAGRCGGCDWQHIALAAQRQIKADLVREQLTRLGGEEAGRWDSLIVEALPGDGDDDGLHWRTRMRYAVNAEGRAGLHAHHTKQVVPIDSCLIASRDIGGPDVLGQVWPGTREVVAVQPDGPAIALPDARPGQARVTQRAVGREWTFDATAFWQVHVGAADALAHVVRDLLQPRPGEHLLDLYSGVGLFAGALVNDLGAGGRIDAIEGDEVAIRGARRSLHDAPTIHLHQDRVDLWLRSTGLRRCDIVVLDPPRAGAGRQVIERIIRMSPRAIAYVACDPSALARDIATARSLGWRLESLRALDLFPMTHHVECIALLVPAVSLDS